VLLGKIERNGNKRTKGGKNVRNRDVEETGEEKKV
jgi:hypothetical protein